MNYITAIRNTFVTKLEAERVKTQTQLDAMPSGQYRAQAIYAYRHNMPHPRVGAEFAASDAALDAAIAVAKRARLQSPAQIQAALRRAGIELINGRPSLVSNEDRAARFHARMSAEFQVKAEALKAKRGAMKTQAQALK